MIRKNGFPITLLSVVFLLLFCTPLLQAQDSSYSSITGKVVDSNDKKALPYVTLILEKAGISTVANTDGEFLLKLLPEYLSDTVNVSYMSYKSQRIAVKELVAKEKNLIRLEPAPINLQATVITAQSPEELVTAALQKLSNYSDHPVQMTGFYREGLKRNRGYVSLAEAVVDIYKAPYSSAQEDAARIYKGRKSTDAQHVDTVLFKQQGGINTALLLDVVKNPRQVFGEKPTNEYTFTTLESTTINGRRQHVIAFNQKPVIPIPLYRGKIYIDTETLGISRIEFNLNVEDKAKESANLFVQKAPAGMTITPTSASYLISYTEQNGIWYYSYARADVKFKVKWSRKIFNTQFAILSEMAITDKNIGEKNLARFKAKEQVKSTDIIVERIGDFSDPDFWGQYNIIEPDASIENAIKKLGKQQQKSDAAKLPKVEVQAKP